MPFNATDCVAHVLYIEHNKYIYSRVPSLDDIYRVIDYLHLLTCLASNLWLRLILTENVKNVIFSLLERCSLTN